MGDDMAVKKYPCAYMRGGTSKAVVFHEKDLPHDKTAWDELFLKVMGSPDVKQIDGMGGTVSSTSKVAIIAPSDREDADVNYTFRQVDIDIAHVDHRANCGNISSVVGPFAIDEGLVKAEEPVTVVRIFNTNTQKYIEEHVRVVDGKADVYGDTEIKGVPGTGSPIDMYFLEPGGATTGSLLPTGQARNTINMPDGKSIEVSIIDCSNSVVFVKAEDIGLVGTELQEVNDNVLCMRNIEYIRGQAAVACGFVDDWEKAGTLSTSVPKVGIISSKQDYISMDGQDVHEEDMDICVRAISVGKMHKAYPMTMAVCTGAAANIEGTIVQEVLGGMSWPELRLGHASGVTSVKTTVSDGNIEKGGVVRTARRIMDGYVYVRE